MISLFFGYSASAGISEWNKGLNTVAGDSGAGYKTGADAQDPTITIIPTIINVFLSLLGVIFVAMMVYAGYLWMTAMGEKGPVEKAQDIIKNSITGLILVLAAYAISAFVISRLAGSTLN